MWPCWRRSITGGGFEASKAQARPCVVSLCLLPVDQDVKFSVLLQHHACQLLTKIMVQPSEAVRRQLNALFSKSCLGLGLHSNRTLR